MDSIESLLKEYLDYLEHERHLAIATRTSYKSDLMTLDAFLKGKPVVEITLDDLRAFSRHMSKQGRAITTIRRKIWGLGTFWEWLILKGLVKEVITKNVYLPKKPRKSPKWLSIEQITRFLETESPARGKWAAERNQVAFAVLVWLGLRRSEVLKLMVEDVDLEKGVILIRDAKGSQDRELPLPQALSTMLEPWLAQCEPETHLFPSTYGGQWKAPRFAKAFKQHLEAAGLGGLGITPHTFRHTFASWMVARGVHITTVQELLGHKHISSTMIYIHHDPSSLRAALENHVLNDTQKK